MSQWLRYKGYCAKPEYSIEDNVFFGRIYGIADLVSFEAENASDLQSAFEAAVDDYLETCNRLGKQPEQERHPGNPDHPTTTP